MLRSKSSSTITGISCPSSLCTVLGCLKPEACRCLEQQALVHELEAFLQDALGCIQDADSDKAADKQLKRQGFRCSHKVYQAAFDHLQVNTHRCASAATSNAHLSKAAATTGSCVTCFYMQVAKCAQHLQLPAGCLPNITNTDASTYDSMRHLLGVTPQQLIQTHVPNLAAAQVHCNQGSASRHPPFLCCAYKSSCCII